MKKLFLLLGILTISCSIASDNMKKAFDIMTVADIGINLGQILKPVFEYEQGGPRAIFTRQYRIGLSNREELFKNDIRVAISSRDACVKLVKVNMKVEEALEFFFMLSPMGSSIVPHNKNAEFYQREYNYIYRDKGKLNNGNNDENELGIVEQFKKEAYAQVINILKITEKSTQEYCDSECIIDVNSKNCIKLENDIKIRFEGVTEKVEILVEKSKTHTFKILNDVEQDK